MVTEIAIGRHTKRNPIGAYRAIGSTPWAFVSVLAVLSSAMILSYYNIVAGWALGYVVEMMQGHFAIGGDFGRFAADWLRTGFYAMAFIFTTAIIVASGVKDGIERVSKILMPALLAIILFLVIYALTLPDAWRGLAFYLAPDFSKLNGTVVTGAFAHAFFSLSLGLGALMTCGSYLSQTENIVRAAT
jgi:neurotransmitter:Na+ symporter, NSS family